MEENLDEKTIRELEEVLGTRIYPGTEVMKDVGTHHFVKAGEGSHSVLIPQPSDDPRDPLNWSPFWKASTIFCVTSFAFGQSLGPLALAPMFEYYVQEWNRSLADVVQFTGVAILILGFSNFIWVPMMVCFGRRPVAIISSLISAGSSIWRAQATSYNSFMGLASNTRTSSLNGIGAGPCETLMPQVIADVIFLHERGTYQTLYFSMYFIALMIGPVISGAMALNVGWRNFWWLNTAMLLFTAVLCVFFFPETRYNRVYGSSAKGTDVSPNRAGIIDEKAVDLSPEATHAERNNLNPETGAATNVALDEGGAGRAEGSPDAKDGDLQRGLTHQDPWLGRGTPSKKQFFLFQRYEGNIFRELWLPFYIHIYPIVEFAAFVVSWSASGFLVVNLSQTQAFAAPPYNYSSQTIGLFNLAVLAGGLIGLFTCGPFSDWIAAHLTARNNGVREPEMRLVAMVPYVIVMIIGSIITSVGYDNGWPWQAIVIIGYACLGMQVSALPSIASTYAIDSYKPITGPMFVTITINKNVWGYGVSKFLTPWAASSGFKAPILTNMALITLWCSCGIIFWFWGKTFRGLTKNSFVHRL